MPFEIRVFEIVVQDDQVELFSLDLCPRIDARRRLNDGDLIFDDRRGHFKGEAV